MTNIIALLASVVTSLTTNITTTDNAVYEQLLNPCTCPNRSGPSITAEYHHHGYHNGSLITPATEKTETEIVTERRVATFSFEGQSIEKELAAKEISRVARIYKLDQQWRLSDVRTNEPATVLNGITNLPTFQVYTNGVFTNQWDWLWGKQWGLEAGKGVTLVRSNNNIIITAEPELTQKGKERNKDDAR